MSMARCIQIIGLETLPEITEGCDLAQLLVAAAEAEGTPLSGGDIVVVAQKIVSKAEGLIVNLTQVRPSEDAVTIGRVTGKDPRFVEVILRESKKVLKVSKPYLITETRFGHICLNSGVDRSNVAGSPEICSLLPRDPDASARALRKQLEQRTGCHLAVIISDTYSRPHRFAQVDMAIGVSGIRPVKTYRGDVDPYGYTLKVKMQAIADELAASAELVIGQVKERIPAAIIRGYTFTSDERSSARELSLIKKGTRDIFEGVVLVPDGVEPSREELRASHTD
jgi:coenzyme F420-0:L-glutamate ligase/coenzyme F420-1:gamma-L-glutamate ligase